LRFCSLGSGSTGNATVVESCQNGTFTRVLLDCGMAYKQLESRLSHRGLAIDDIDAVFVTHEHSDHFGCAKQLAVQVRLPVWMSRGTYKAMASPDFEGQLRIASDGIGIAIGHMQLQPFTVPHDSKEPLQVVVVAEGQKLGLLTDLGHVTPHLTNYLKNLDALILECNHDVSLLQTSKYPPFLKQRVAGAHGHLNNVQAADCLQLIQHQGLQYVVAAHLSEQNNHTDLVLAELRRVWVGQANNLVVADGLEGFDWLTLN
jgi:phosphoribosyl 1,2-cyclic phosphodiesterase